MQLFQHLIPEINTIRNIQETRISTYILRQLMHGHEIWHGGE